MTAPRKASDLIGLGEPRGALLVLDPGKTTGTLLSYADWRHCTAGTRALDSLADYLAAVLLRGETVKPELVVCESFVLRGGAGNNDCSMPASQGIGMARMVCHAAGVPLYLVPPNCKRAGHAALDEAGKAAYAACRNDHERDVVDLAGYVLRCALRRPDRTPREMRRTKCPK